MVKRIGTKFYISTPWGEIQIGTRYHTISVWHKGKCYRIKKAKI